MIILNMGIPRSGTIWAFNVLRYILNAVQIPHETINANTPAKVNSIIEDLKPGGSLIIHFHDITVSVRQLMNKQDAISFFNYRDPRDVVVSQMHLHDAPFHIATQMTMLAFKNFEVVLQSPGVMLIPYPHIKMHAAALIFQMALRMGKYIDLRTVHEIAEKTSVQKHKRIMKQVNLSGEGGNVQSDFIGKRNIKCDATYLINDRHIQSGVNGRWKHELSTSQQEEVNQIFAPIIKFLGFD